jgi:hypothetical protein
MTTEEICMKTFVRWAFIINSILWLPSSARTQSLGKAGTIRGSVIDGSRGAISKFEVAIHDPVGGYTQSCAVGTDVTALTAIHTLTNTLSLPLAHISWGPRTCGHPALSF